MVILSLLNIWRPEDLKGEGEGVSVGGGGQP